jgi:hypothetical protein
MKSWQPLLTGSLAERARRVVDEIAAVLAPGPAADAILSFPSLASGKAGAALFFAYRAQSPGAAGAADLDAAAAFLDQSTAALASMPLPPDLYAGIAGVAWAAEHLYGPHFATDATDATDANGGGGSEAHPRAAAPAAAGGPRAASTASEAPAHPESPEDPARDARDEGDAGDGEDPMTEIDDALLRYVGHTPWTADYDLIRGLAGIGVYALERLPRPGAVACLTKIVDRLSETAEHGPQGTTWHTAPELLPDWQQELYPKGYYNLGVAHGVPAVIALLSAAAAATAGLGAAGDPAAAELARRARSLADAASRWLLARRLPPGQASWFAGTFTPEIPPQQSRLAWCYGDPGIAAALLVAARAAGDAELERQAVELAVAAAARPIESSGVRDAGLCHGSAGLAHLFNRIYQETGEPHLAAASRRWFEHALDFQLPPGQGLAGYRAFWVDPGDFAAESWRDEAGLLEGVTGIGLALLGGLGDFEPAWDRVMMLSAATGQPPRP